MHSAAARLHHTHHSLLHIHLLGRRLRRSFRRNSRSLESLFIARERLGELGALSDLRTFPVEDVDRDGEEEAQTGQDGGWVLECVRRSKVLVDCGIRSGSVDACLDGGGKNAYMDQHTWPQHRRGSLGRGHYHR